MIISENTVMYDPRFTAYHTHTNTRTPEHPGDVARCDLFVLLVQWTEAMEVVTV